MINSWRRLRIPPERAWEQIDAFCRQTRLLLDEYTILLTITQAETTEEIALAREFMLEYAAWLEFKLCFQGFDEELQSLPGKYSPPAGRLLIACWEQEPAAIGALRPLGEPGVCEMKRLYVRPRFRGHAIGRALAEKLIQEARSIGYKFMRLDTVSGKMDQAIELYRQLGFKEIDPYYGSPVPGTIFMEVALGNPTTDY